MKNNKVVTIIIVVLILIFGMTACSKNEEEILVKDTKNDAEENIQAQYDVQINEDSVIFVDSMDNEKTIKKHPERVVILQNSLLEIWDSCGGSVVGRLEATDEKPVENALNAETVGTVGTPNLEKILSLQPDIVMLLSDYSSHREMIASLEKSNIEVIAFNDDLRDDYYRTLRIFSALTGREDLYEEIITLVKDGVEKLIENAPSKDYKAVILRATGKAINVRDSNTTLGEMLKDLNVINISDNENMSADNKTFSMEKLIQEDPDFIFVITMGSDVEKIKERLKLDVESNPAWASMKAVKEGKYIVLPKELYVYKPNLRYLEAYENLAEILYPEIFAK